MSLNNEEDALIHSIRNDEMIDAFQWSPSHENGIICYSSDHSVQIWDVDDISPTKSFSRDDLSEAIGRQVPSECYCIPSDCVESNESLIVVGSGLQHLATSCLRVLAYNNKEKTLTPYATFSDYHPEITQSIIYIERFGRFISVSEDSTVTAWSLENQKEERIIKNKKKSANKPY